MPNKLASARMNLMPIWGGGRRGPSSRIATFADRHAFSPSPGYGESNTVTGHGSCALRTGNECEEWTRAVQQVALLFNHLVGMSCQSCTVIFDTDQ